MAQYLPSTAAAGGIRRHHSGPGLRNSSTAGSVSAPDDKHHPSPGLYEKPEGEPLEAERKQWLLIRRTLTSDPRQ
jgi:hypothetical protein